MPDDTEDVKLRRVVWSLRTASIVLGQEAQGYKPSLYDDFYCTLPPFM